MVKLSGVLSQSVKTQLRNSYGDSEQNDVVDALPCPAYDYQMSLRTESAI